MLGGPEECLLEGYRVRPRDRGYIKLRARFFTYGCVDRITTLASALPDAMTQECIEGEIGSLIFRTAGKPASLVVRIDYEAKKPDGPKEALQGPTK